MVVIDLRRVTLLKPSFCIAVQMKADCFKLVLGRGHDAYAKELKRVIDRANFRPVGTKNQFAILEYCRTLPTHAAEIFGFKKYINGPW